MDITKQKNILLSQKINVYKNVSKEDFKKELDNKPYFEQIKSYYTIQDEYEQLYKFFKPTSYNRFIDGYITDLRIRKTRLFKSDSPNDNYCVSDFSQDSDLEQFEKDVHLYIKKENYSIDSTQNKCYNLFCIYEYILNNLSEDVEKDIELFKQYIENDHMLCYNKSLSYTNNIIYKNEDFYYRLTNDTTILCKDCISIYETVTITELYNMAINNFSVTSEKDIIRITLNLLDRTNTDIPDIKELMRILLTKVSNTYKISWLGIKSKLKNCDLSIYPSYVDYKTKMVEQDTIYINRKLILNDLLAD